MRILSLFDRSGRMVEPWFKAGHDVMTVDIEPARHNMPSMQVSIDEHFRDVIMPTLGQWDCIFSFPPCTDLASSGAWCWERKGEEEKE